MKKLISVLAVLFAMQTGVFAASSDFWCVGSTTKGVCVSNAGSFLPAVDNTNDIGSAAKSFKNMWVDGTATIKNLTVTGTLSPYTTGTFTGEDISLTYGIAAATGAFSGAVTVGSTLDVTGAAGFTSIANSGTSSLVGNVTMGAALFKSTMTAANGNWAITGNVVSAAAVQGATVTGTTSVTSPLYIATGPVRKYPRTKAQINAIVSPAIGDSYFCSDCTAVTQCDSTGTVVGSFVKVTDKTAVCD